MKGASKMFKTTNQIKTQEVNTPVQTKELAEKDLIAKKDSIVAMAYHGFRGAAVGASIAAGLKACGATIDEKDALALTVAGAIVSILYSDATRWRSSKNSNSIRSYQNSTYDYMYDYMYDHWYADSNYRYFYNF